MEQDDAVIRLWLTSPRSMYLLIARLRRMARPRRYSRVSTKTENETKRRTMTPTTMPVTVCLMTIKQKTILKHSRKLDFLAHTVMKPNPSYFFWCICW